MTITMRKLSNMKLTPTTMKVLLPLASVLAMGLAQAATPPLPTAPLAMPQLRISDQAVSADQQAYRLLQERIKKLNDGGVRVGDYYLSKAQCWLDVSFHEYTRNDRSAFPLQALQESAKIVAALEDGSTPNPGDATPLVNDATRLRDDLWSSFGTLRASPGFACAAQKVACGEVELVHAGNEYKQPSPPLQHARPTSRSGNRSRKSCRRASSTNASRSTWMPCSASTRRARPTCCRRASRKSAHWRRA